MRLVIGLAGRIGSGKSEIGKYLSNNYGASQHRFSQILEDLIKRLHITPERETLQRLGAALRSSISQGVLVNAFKADIEGAASDIVVVDGIRYLNEVEMLREFKKNILIYTSVPSAIRYERIKKRGERGESNLTFEEFMEAENRETEKHLDEVKAVADIVLDNSGSKEEFHRKIDEIIKVHSP
jgi:dephospho-CoA kinase